MAVTWWGDQVREQIRRAVWESLLESADRVHEEMISLILDTPKTGRVYGGHQASAPGEPPASQFGLLVASLTTIPDPRRMTVTIAAPGIEYANYLEFGTRRMEPRPFMRPALAAHRDAIEQDIIRAVRRVIRTPGVSAAVQRRELSPVSLRRRVRGAFRGV